jgi:ABC-2 type transport system ATP-binding protein
LILIDPGDNSTNSAVTVPAVTVRGVTKSYGDVVALAGIDIDIQPGTVFALLGPNGAGKTTLVRILTTLIDMDDGEAHVAGHDVRRDQTRLRTVVGLAGQSAAVDPILTGRENLEMVARLYHLSKTTARQRARELLQQFDLVESADRQVGTYSGGMRRRLDVAASLVAEPEVLFLDEPTAGLDPRGRLDLWQVIRDLVRAGTTVLLTTQYLEEADQLADRIAVIDHGRLIAEGTAEELKYQIGGEILTVSVAGVVRELDEAGATLDEVFLALTGRPAEDGATSNAKGELLEPSAATHTGGR